MPKSLRLHRRAPTHWVTEGVNCRKRLQMAAALLGRARHKLPLHFYGSMDTCDMHLLRMVRTGPFLIFRAPKLTLERKRPPCNLLKPLSNKTGKLNGRWSRRVSTARTKKNSTVTHSPHTPHSHPKK